MASGGLRIETLINNAGFGLHGPLLDADPVRLPQMLQLNMVTLTELTQQYGQDMARRGRGRILLVASLLGFMPAPFCDTSWRYAVLLTRPGLAASSHVRCSGFGIN